MIEKTLNTELKKNNISLNDFSELLIRLLDYGVIMRNESQVEAQLYDRYLVCEDLLEDYLSVLHIRLSHDRTFQILRAFPPGAEVPNLPDNDNQPFNGGLRYRPSQVEVAVILTLRVEYEKALREGNIDENGCAMLAFEGLSFAMKNVLKRSLPENAGERKQLFTRLRQLRLIQFSHEDHAQTEDAWLRIQPSISSFVTQAALDEVYPENQRDVSSTVDQQDGIEKNVL